MARAWAVSSAASTSMSRSGSADTDSTGIPSLATKDNARTPPMRSLIRLSCSRNMLRARLESLQVPVEQIGLLRGDRGALGRHEAGQEMLGTRGLATLRQL